MSPTPAASVASLPTTRQPSDPPIVPTIAAALSSVMGAVRSVGKDGLNTTPGQNYKFRGIDAVVNAVGPALRAHGVIVTPDIRLYEHGTIHVGQNQKPMGHVRVIVNYTFTGPAGDTIVCSAPGEAMDSGDKATSKAMSVAFRTALLQALALPTDEPDPDETTYERSNPPEPVRHEPVRQGPPPASGVRAQIDRWLTANGLTRQEAADRYRTEYEGVEIGDESNPAVLSAFWATWQKELKAQTGGQA